MAKGKGLTFTVFAVLGALTGYATYMARKNEFSEETIDKYDNFLNKAKNVKTDIERTYTSIGDKDEFTANTKNLTESAKKLASKASDLVMSATSDMYKYAKTQVSDIVEAANSTNVANKTKTNNKKKPVKKPTKTKTSKKK